MRAGYRRDLAIGVIDWTAGGPSRSGHYRVGLSGVAVKWQYATRKILPKHTLDLSKQLLATLTDR